MATLPDKPVTGEATKVSWAEGVIDYLSDLNSRIGAGGGGVPANGSFELDTNADGDPDSWDVTESSATLSLDSSDAIHGRQSVKFSFGATTGTGTVTNDTFLECAEGQRLELSYYVKGSWENSAGGLPHKAHILFFDDTSPTPAALSTVTLVDEGDTPTFWDKYSLQTVVPAGAFYYKIRLQAGDGATAVAGQNVKFDQVECRVYHGRVNVAWGSPLQLLDPVSPTTTTYTVTVTDEALGSGVLDGERPTKVAVYYLIEVAASESVQVTITDGYGVVVWDAQHNNSGGSIPATYTPIARPGYLWVALNERGEFTVTIDDDEPTDFNLDGYAYEV